MVINMEFSKLDLHHISLIKDRLYKYAPNKANDYTLTGLFMWREYLNTYIAIDNNDIYIYQVVNGRYLFYLPLCKDVKLGLRNIVLFANENGIKYGFYPLCKDELTYLDELGLDYSVNYSEDYRDYLHDKKDLIGYQGKKFHSQRNHLNKFLSSYPEFKYERITETNLERVQKFFEDYCEKNPFRDKTEEEEYLKIPELLDNMDDYNLFGYYLEINGFVEGFELGEIVDNMYYSHVQKANTMIYGIYAVLVNFLVKELPDKVSLINREEDMGNEGLRTSKQRYRPCGFVEKYMIFVEDNN